MKAIFDRREAQVVERPLPVGQDGCRIDTCHTKDVIKMVPVATLLALSIIRQALAHKHASLTSPKKKKKKKSLIIINVCKDRMEDGIRAKFVILLKYRNYYYYYMKAVIESEARTTAVQLKIKA